MKNKGNRWKDGTPTVSLNDIKITQKEWDKIFGKKKKTIRNEINK